MRVDHEEHEVGLRDRGADLPLDVRRERGEVLPGVVDAPVLGRVDPIAPRVHQFHEPRLVVAAAGRRLQLDDRRDAVARDARRRVHDRDAATREPVEEARLADVRPSDDRQARQGHQRGPPNRLLVSGAGDPAEPSIEPLTWLK
jgi:hypothetical protein